MTRKRTAGAAFATVTHSIDEVAAPMLHQGLC